ncbi:DUF4344 domain-containing metallopeptidase [Enterovibrio norvegicus]|uniref:DUF4344 domain-containing metallopeptidase n=1 Tax=Enterovibrio norvegicus TaxID=188144 RepID=UPI0035533877
MRTVLFPVLFTAVLFLMSLPLRAETNAIFEAPKTENEKSAKALIEVLSLEMVKLVNQEAPVSEPLTIHYTRGENAYGPHYDPSKNTINMPYGFIHYALDKFNNAKPSIDGLTPEAATQAAILHTLFHEYGHAYLYLWDFPVLGKEEDAVDSFATLMMIIFYDAETAFTGVDLFALEDSDVEFIEDTDMWGEHSLDAQRYSRSLCMIYGSDPSAFADLMDDNLVEAERDVFCPYEFQTQKRNWFRVIDMNNEKQ